MHVASNYILIIVNGVEYVKIYKQMYGTVVNNHDGKLATISYDFSFFFLTKTSNKLN